MEDFIFPSTLNISTYLLTSSLLPSKSSSWVVTVQLLQEAYIYPIFVIYGILSNAVYFCGYFVRMLWVFNQLRA